VSFRAVVFDLGGVIFPSPLDSFRLFEQANGLPHRFISDVVLADPEGGAWARLERGELTIAEFCAAFEVECAAAGQTVDATALMGSLGGFDARPEMVAAIQAIRARGLLTGALTNNWPGTEESDAEESAAEPSASEPSGSAAGAPSVMTDLFDTIVESAVVGLRKPDPRIYELTCDRLGVEPAHAVFLDDLGVNLKPARALGMTTIKVGEPAVALAELTAVLGFPLDPA
jgi:putative hydrolase of the HAD superfamily